MNPANKEKVASFVRMLLSFIGAMLTAGAAHKLFGQVIDAAYWQEITGVVMAAGSIYWSIATKTANIEKVEGAARQIIAFVCGILASNSILNSQEVAAITAFVGALGTWFQSNFSKDKSVQLDSGAVKVADLKGVNN